MRCFVLDKSYLNAKNALWLMSAHRVLVPDILVAEMATASVKNRDESFAKLVALGRSVAVVGNVGRLLKAETENHESCNILKNHILSVGWPFSPGPDFVIDKYDAINDVRQDLINEGLEFDFRAENSIEYFPELMNYRAGGDPVVFQEAFKKIQNINFIRTIYQLWRGDCDDWPDPALIDEDWAFFRYVQGHLTYYLEQIRLNGSKRKGPNVSNCEHEYSDLQYVIIGALIGNLATNDARQKRLLKIVAPSTLLYTDLPD